MFNPERKPLSELIADARLKAQHLLAERTNRVGGRHPDERVPREILDQQQTLAVLQAMLRQSNKGYHEAIERNTATIVQAEEVFRLLEIEMQVAMNREHLATPPSA